MACRQVFSTRLRNGATATRYVGPMMQRDWQTASPGVPWQTAGVFRNFTIVHEQAPGAGASFTYTFVKNGVDTALVITIAGASTSGSNNANSVTVAQDDLVYWRRTTSGTPTLSPQRLRGEYWGIGTGESAYGSLGEISGTLTFRTSLFNLGQFNTGNGGVLNFEVVGAAGNLTRLAVVLNAAPGTGNSFEFAVFKNGTKQDGAGGTVDTRITISDAATSGTWSGTLAFVAGDLVYYEVVPSGTPGSPSVGVGAKFVATTDGESQGGALVFFDLPTTGGPYYASPNQYSQEWNASEAEDVTTLSADVTIRAMRVRLSSTVSTGPITFTLRRNGGATALAITITSGNQTGSDADSVVFTAGDTWSLEYAQSGSPGIGRIAAIGFVIFDQRAPQISTSYAIGQDTTVSGASNAVAIGVDGASHTHTVPNIVQVYGNFGVTKYLEFLPMTAPAAPSSGCRMYLDTADGDLKVIHANGNIDIISAN